MAKHRTKSDLIRECARLTKMLKSKCVDDCMCGNRLDCQIYDCVLYELNPYRDKTINIHSDDLDKKIRAQKMLNKS